MSDVLSPSARTMVLILLVSIGFFAFFVAKAGDANMFGNSDGWNCVVAANAPPDTVNLAVSNSSQQATPFRQNCALADRESGTGSLVIFGIGVVAFAFRRRRSDRLRYQFA